jgi:hypothetical protein
LFFCPLRLNGTVWLIFSRLLAGGGSETQAAEGGGPGRAEAATDGTQTNAARGQKRARAKGTVRVTTFIGRVRELTGIPYPDPRTLVTRIRNQEIEKRKKNVE